MRLFLAALAVVFTLAGCASRRTTDISVDDASQAYKVKFGTVLNQQTVSVRSDDSRATATGALLGGGASALISQTNGAALAGLLVGAFAGSQVHAFAETANAVEYTIALADGETIVIAQPQGSDDRVFQRGEAVMVQYGANANRVLAAGDLPDRIDAPKQVRVAGASARKIDVRTCEKSGRSGASRESCVQH